MPSSTASCAVYRLKTFKVGVAEPIAVVAGDAVARALAPLAGAGMKPVRVVVVRAEDDGGVRIGTDRLATAKIRTEVG